MDNALAYFIPHHGRPKISLGVPESFRLNVCPAACGRRTGIRALGNGTADRQAFLYITEADVISGDYEGAIGDAVEELLELISPAPRAFLIYVNCIDDFLGTDEEALLDRLRRRFPALPFAICHIDPVSAQDPVPPGARMQDHLYALLSPRPREDSVNLIGNFVSPDPAGELFQVLGQMGISTVRELHALDRFEEFQRMAGARLNLVLMEMGRFAAENMEKRLGIPWLDVPVSYSVAQVTRDYQSIAEALGRPLPDLSAWRARALEAVARARTAVGDTPLIVDASAAMRPFAMAKSLREYGFQVAAVFLAHDKDMDRAEREWLQEHSPQTRVVYAGRFDATAAALPKEGIAIGYDGAYTLRAPRFVDIQRDETLFGFHGISVLMDLLAAAMKGETRWE